MRETKCTTEKRGKKAKKEKGDEVSSPALEWNGSDDYLMVHGSKSSSNEGSHPEDPLKAREKKSQ